MKQKQSITGLKRNITAKVLAATLLTIISFSSYAGPLTTCAREWRDAPAYDRGVEINQCIKVFARNESLKTCLLAARFIDDSAMSYDYQRAAANCLVANRINSEYQCETLNGESDPRDEYNDYYIEDCYYALESLESGIE